MFGPERVLSLPHDRMSAAAARAQVRHSLLAAGLPRSLVDDATVVVSELVSNAVIHGRPMPGDGIQVGWQRAEDVADGVRVTITDGGATSVPHPRAAGSMTGRGLHIVARLAREWGVERSTDESTVWAVVDGSGAAARQ